MEEAAGGQQACGGERKGDGADKGKVNESRRVAGP